MYLYVVLHLLSNASDAYSKAWTYNKKDSNPFKKCGFPNYSSEVILLYLATLSRIAIVNLENVVRRQNNLNCYQNVFY